MTRETKFDLMGTAIVLSGTVAVALLAKNGWEAASIAVAGLVTLTGVLRALKSPKWRSPFERAQDDGRLQEREEQKQKQQREHRPQYARVR